MNAAAQRRAISEAVAELARRVYERDQFPSDERPDPRAFAAEVVTDIHERWPTKPVDLCAHP
jgi:hypothetical protein